jgi:V8-like Glu-specific endopeptidase
MSRIRRRPAGRRATGAVIAAAAVIALTASACGPGEDDGDAGADPSPSEPADDAPGGDGDRWADLLDRLPVDFDVDDWVNGEWANWDPDTWLGEAGQYINVIIEEFWDPKRIWEAEDNDKSVDEDDVDEGDGKEPETDDPADDRGVTDPFPPKVEAAEKETPYSASSPAVGKLLFETPEGTAACTAAVVKDPDNPGKSNLVATAGHCVHAGAEGGWFRQLVFVPAYNDNNLPLADLEAGVETSEIAPHGIWWASYVGTTDYWRDNGANMGGAGAHQDFAVIMVEPEDQAVTQSLEELTGAAYEIDFEAPAVSGIGSTEVIGYPVAPPYDGQTMYSCTGDLARLSMDATQPVMYSAGCSMTGGSSGGPWIAGDKLISVTSIGPADNSWLAGPRLEDDARAVYDAVRAS